MSGKEAIDHTTDDTPRSPDSDHAAPGPRQLETIILTY